MVGRDCSLHIGTNWDGTFAEDQSGIVLARQLCGQAAARGLKASTLVGRDATSANVLAWIDGAAKVLQSGDVMLVTYLGHGAQVADLSGDEDDSCDEVWALTESDVLLDDVMFEHILQIAEGVEVRFIVDACHSATSVRLPPGTPLKDRVKRLLPDELECRVAVPSRPVTPRCSVFTLAAARDKKESDFGKLSYRIAAVLKEWHESAVEGTWDELRTRLKSLSIPPSFTIYGTSQSDQMLHSRAFYPRV